MGKKSKDPFVREVNRVLKRKTGRQHKIPRAYLLAIADSLHRTNPTKEIIYNTLVDVCSVCYEKAYIRSMEDQKLFRQKQCKHFKDDFGEFCNMIDDMIHVKANQQKQA